MLKSIDKLSRKERKTALEKIAKKSTTYGISGKHNRKSIEKVLSKATERYNNLKNIVNNALTEKAKIDDTLNSAQEELKLARKDIMYCHDVLRNMDFAGAAEVRIGKNDDIAYACDGKWFYYDTENGDKKPYAKWKKELKTDKTSEDSNESNDADLKNELELDPDGIDITL